MDRETIVLLYEEKIKKLLDKFLQPDFEIKADTYLNLLLSHLAGKDNKVLGEHLLSFPIFTEWVFKCVKHWEDGYDLPPANVIAFVLQIASLLSKDESCFNLFNSDDIYTRLNCTIKDASSSPLVQLAYIRLLTSFFQHKSGTNWLIARNDWTDILNSCLNGQTLYIIHDGHNFIYNLLLAASVHNQNFCKTVVEKIMLVFKQTRLSSTSKIVEVNSENLQKILMPSLRLIVYILENHLKSDAFFKQDYNLPQVFVSFIDAEHDFWNSILTGIKNQDLVYEIIRVMMLNNFFKVAIDCKTPMYEYKQNEQMMVFIIQLLKQLILKYDTINILKIGFISQYYWNLITPRLENVLHNRDRVSDIFDHQVTMFQILPIIAISYKYCEFNMEAASETGSSRDEFLTKLFNSLHTDTVRWIYQFRKRLEADTKNIFQNAQKSFMYIMKSRPYLKREAAILAFQFFVYILKDMTRVMVEKRETVEIFMNNAGYFVVHLDAIAVFIQEYDITWQESVEITSIMKIIMKFIQVAHWPPRVIVQVLRLVNLCIARFTTPNLALLVDRTCDSALANLGPVLFAKLHDTSWEVRDSTLEVLYTICSIAHTKFSSFKQLILEHDLPLLIVTIGMHDGESYVRASALKCVKEMVQVPEVWQAVLNDQGIAEKMLQILYNETEANVRCEAVSVITAMYEQELFESSIIESINQVMVYAATSDLHWEVKINTLVYWNNVINKQLTLQGMIDGVFPDVTFSCDNKKIVTLTNDEIRNRLKKVLLQLSECGCLGVLLTAVQDECDIEVSKKAVEITKVLSTLLQKYGVTFTNVDPHNKISRKSVHANNAGIRPNLDVLGISDDVISDIVNARDVQLLPDVFIENSISGSSKEIFSNSTTLKITPQDFFNFIKGDMDIWINQRKNWLNNIDDLGSLLDDMLKNYDLSDDINAMDCY